MNRASSGGAPGEWRAVTDRVARVAAAGGVDLIQPFRIAWYNALVDAPYRMPDLGRADALGLVFANTRALWPRFLAALARDPALASDPDPLDRYCAGVVMHALAAAAEGAPCAHEVRHAPEPPPRRVAIQTAAHAAGLAARSETNMCVHPVHGPWIGLRAVAALDLPGPPGPAPAPAPPCDCAGHCRPAFERALAASTAEDGAARPLADTWRLWLAVRDACPAGRDHRYPDDQIRYHYLKDRAILKKYLNSNG